MHYTNNSVTYIFIYLLIYFALVVSRENCCTT